MVTGHYTEVSEEVSPLPNSQATIRWLITKKEGAPNFTLRMIEIKRRGDKIPLHRHDYEHEIFIISGQGSALSQQGAKPAKEGNFLLTLAGEEHGFENTGDGPFRFICVIPNPR